MRSARMQRHVSSPSRPGVVTSSRTICGRRSLQVKGHLAKRRGQHREPRGGRRRRAGAGSQQVVDDEDRGVIHRHRSPPSARARDLRRKVVNADQLLESPSKPASKPRRGPPPSRTRSPPRRDAGICGSPRATPARRAHRCRRLQVHEMTSSRAARAAAHLLARRDDRDENPGYSSTCRANLSCTGPPRPGARGGR